MCYEITETSSAGQRGYNTHRREINETFRRRSGVRIGVGGLQWLLTVVGRVTFRVDVLRAADLRGEDHHRRRLRERPETAKLEAVTPAAVVKYERRSK